MSQFLLDLEVAIFKAWGEAGHIAESLVAARVAADQCTDQHAELMKNFTNQAIPDLSPATVELLRVRHPEFCSSETGQAALSQRVRGIKKSTRAANAAANLSHAQDMFWLWVGTGLLEEDGAVASLQDIHSKLRESIRRYRTCQARIVSLALLRGELEAVTRHLRQTQAIYAQNTSLKPGADLAAAIEAAAAATTGGVDADGLPVLHPDLMVQIEFETYARLVPKKEEKQAA